MQLIWAVFGILAPYTGPGKAEQKAHTGPALNHEDRWDVRAGSELMKI
jgi:hypothetical protein